MNTESRLEKVLTSGNFAVTAECGPPKGSDVAALQEKGKHLLNCVDAVNVTDNQTAIVRMSSVAASAILKNMGHEPVLQMVTRDRNRIALQSDLFGAYALGVRNVLCLTGDHHSFGNQKETVGVFDLDSIQLLRTVRDMREQGTIIGGEAIQVPPKMFIGAAENPFADPISWRVVRLAKKAAAGADFIQTQCIFNVDRFAEFMKQAHDRGITEKLYVLAGITPLKTVGMARYMANKVAGMEIPEELISRMAGVPKEKQAEEGIKITVETIQRVREIPGVAGIHLMAIEWEHKVPEILKAAGLDKRPAA
ncbi:methylenetetrahydrofolate reductase [Desulfomonile tiedjei]|uniref:Methylenetetrahydrofolate reductase n=1 Tax=Desulfomonile tiedjei (strain ATCC 49306 / DSM 6799 / DCB-1) TaxID=706587 RepID=I4C7S5_DESTA|nr:methylenetetrahydrofolate reductase [Desulfomonile tiedjei]AFM25616.1 5,10-methylenetetrahydrofolate reductase [Desulfomonile tiedjei DSM 6799]